MGQTPRDTAVLVTTFLRDDLLVRCIKSIRKFYPDIPLFIGDNGRPDDKKQAFCRKMKATLLELPFDCGVGGTRNEALARIPREYRYVVIVEDDCIFTPQTDLAKWQAVLNAEPTVGIVGCLLKVDDKTEQHYEATMRITDATHYIERVDNPEWRTSGKPKVRYYLCDLVLNVFLARRAVFDELLWDPQFKTAFEHSDFFLSLKTKTGWKVAYTPDVWMWHKKDAGRNIEYMRYRQRPIGWALFGRKWGVKYSVSSFNKDNPVSFEEREARSGVTIKDETLGRVINVLEKNGVRWWLEAGTCLGVIREGDFIRHDPDLDIGIAPGQTAKWDAVRDALLAEGFDLYKEWREGKRKIELSMSFKGLKVDLFWFYEKGKDYWHGAYGPSAEGKWGSQMVFLPHVFPARLFANLKELIFRGNRCFVPSPPEEYLSRRYGKDWRVPNKAYHYWTDCKAIDRNYFSKGKVVYIGGVWDLLHVGHLNILENAKALGTRLVVGVLTDEAAVKYKPRPTIPFEHRFRIVQALSVVDEAIPQSDKDPTQDLKRHLLCPAYIAHGDDWSEVPGEEYVRHGGGKAVILPYTRDISSTKVRRVLQDGGSLVPTDWSKETFAVGIKTFMRDDALYRAIESVKKHFPFPFKLYIADDGPVNPAKQRFYDALIKEGHSVIRTPHESGLSVGRNAIVKTATEDIVLIMDDDMALIDGESIKSMLKPFDADDRIGVVAAYLVDENGRPFENDSYASGIRFERRGTALVRIRNPRQYQKAEGTAFLYADQVPNFFLARREVFNDILWDSRIRIQYEHMDFFLELQKTRWKAAVCVDAKALHVHPNADPLYLRARRDYSSAYFLSKHGLGNVINQY